MGVVKGVLAGGDVSAELSLPACGRGARLGEPEANLVAAGWAKRARFPQDRQRFLLPAALTRTTVPQVPDWKPRNTPRARELRNAATPAERVLWRHLSRGQLGAKFSRQMPLGPFFADFLCRSARLVVELDGFSHALRPEHDSARDRWMRAEGWRVLRFANAEVMGNVEGVVTAIRLALAEGVMDQRSAAPMPTPNTTLAEM